MNKILAFTICIKLYHHDDVVRQFRNSSIGSDADRVERQNAFARCDGECFTLIFTLLCAIY